MKLTQNEAQAMLANVLQRAFPLTYPVMGPHLGRIVDTMYKEGLYIGTTNESVTKITSALNPDTKRS